MAETLKDHETWRLPCTAFSSLKKARAVHGKRTNPGTRCAPEALNQSWRSFHVTAGLKSHQSTALPPCPQRRSFKKKNINLHRRLLFAHVEDPGKGIDTLETQRRRCVFAPSCWPHSHGPHLAHVTCLKCQTLRVTMGSGCKSGAGSSE